VIVVKTLTAPQRPLRRRRPRQRAGQPEPAAVPTSQVSVVGAEPLADDTAAAEWIDRVRRDRKALTARLDEAVEVVNRVLRAHRAAAADPYVREVRGEGALARRVGWGSGAQVAEGRLESAIEVPEPGERRRRTKPWLRPQERLAAVLGGRQTTLACEELVLRARLDVDSRRGREAALQARIALEALLVELGSQAAVERPRAGLESDRAALAGSANQALDRELSESELTQVAGAVERMERALARHRTGAA
jgi:hypothetical protein